MKKQFKLNRLGLLVVLATGLVRAEPTTLTQSEQEPPSEVSSTPVYEHGAVHLTDTDREWDIIRDTHLFLGVKGGWQGGREDNYDHTTPDSALWGVFGGLQFNPAWSWDLGYQSLGDLKAKATGVEVETTLWETAVRYDWYMTHNTSLYGRAGIAFWDMTKSASSVEINDSGISPLVEVGVNHRLTTNFYINAGYQYIHGIGDGDGGADGSIGEYDNNAFSVGLSYHFGSAPTWEPPVPERVFRVREEARTVALSRDSLFISSSSTLLSTSSLEAIREAAKINKDELIYITGHTDSTGGDEMNMQLSQDRAQAVADYLISGGVEPSRLQVVGMGEATPVADNATKEGRAKNRRVDVEFEYTDITKITEEVINP